MMNIFKKATATKRTNNKKTNYVCVCRNLVDRVVYEYRVLSDAEIAFLDRHNISYSYCDKNRHYFEYGLN